VSLVSATKTYPPAVAVKSTEQHVFEGLWNTEEYREDCAGEDAVTEFLTHTKIPKNAECFDFGCGTGRGGLALAELGKAVVTLVDFAENALDEDVCAAIEAQPDRLQWLQADISVAIPKVAPYGYCVNTLECIPPQKVDNTIRNIMRASNHVFFEISTVEGPQNRTVESYEQWLKRFRDLGTVIHWSQSYEDTETGIESMCRFYITSWYDSNEITFDGKHNVESEEIIQNIKDNAKYKDKYQKVVPHQLQDTEVMIVCGGPSLDDYKDEIIKLRAEGMPLITTNGSYNWAIENGMNPSMQMIIDAREFNKRFLRPVVDDCKYFIASQCHPSLFEGMPEDRTYIWHVTGGTIDEKEKTTDLIEECYGDFFPVPGGSTVTLRGLCLLRMLGFHKIHMYGFDSCYLDDRHHAYAQPENNFDYGGIAPVAVGGRAFSCDAWMVSQAYEFMKIMGKLGDEMDLNVVGNGLIAHIIKTGYEMVISEEENEG
jgi:SAM-dependent methyltransferase